MKRELMASAAVVALFFGDLSPAIAQDAANTNQNPPPAGEKLPEVQVIQEQQKAKPKPVKHTKKPTPAAAPVAVSAPPVAEPLEANVVKMSPLGGSEIPVNKVPGSVFQMNSSDIKRDGTVIIQDALQSQVPGLIRCV